MSAPETPNGGTATEDRSFADSLTQVFQSDPSALADPFPVWRRLREMGPVYRHGPAVVIWRNADMRAMLRDPRFTNSSLSRGSVAEAALARLSGPQVDAFHAVSEFESHYVSRTDGDRHARLRAILHHAFTPRRIAQMEALVERYTEELLPPAGTTGAYDLKAFAYSLPLMVICDMLEVPHGDRELIHGWSARLGRNRGGSDPEALMDAHLAMWEFRRYVGEVIEHHRRNPGSEGLIAALLNASEGEKLTEMELTGMYVVLLFAGHETTTNLISIGAIELMRHRDQWDRLCADPSLIGNAVEELLRWTTPVQYTARVPLEDVAIDGVEIAAGETIIGATATANRDPAVFDDPDRLDIERARANQHLSLSFGIHYCLGASLARLEAATALRELTRRFPEMRLGEVEIEWGGHAILRGPASVPLELG